jgi:hypothetical protein
MCCEKKSQSIISYWTHTYSQIYFNNIFVDLLYLFEETVTEISILCSKLNSRDKNSNFPAVALFVIEDKNPLEFYAVWSFFDFARIVEP